MKLKQLINGFDKSSGKTGMEKSQIETTPLSDRRPLDFWPFMLWMLPIILVYGLGALGYQQLLNKRINDTIAQMPLLGIAVISFGWLAWKTRNEFVIVLTLLSLGFFAREWHFEGTTAGVFVVVAILGAWFVLRIDVMRSLIKNTPVEIWVWATALCYLISQLIAKRVFGPNYLNWLPMERQYEVFLEETTETMAHVMLIITSLVAWRQFGNVNSKGNNNEQ
jgi:hypothetical protein